MKTIRVELHHGGASVLLELPAARASIQRIAAVEPLADLGRSLAGALEAPINSPPLRRLAAGARQAVIVVDDNTRQTPAHLILPALVDELEAGGLSMQQVRLVTAGGTHRAMTPFELQEKIGAATLARVTVEQHDAHSPELVHAGLIEGIPVWLNPTVAAADLVVGVSSIVPHRFCGWSGGGKIIVPGVCGIATIEATHLQIVHDPTITLGKVENSVRQAIDRISTAAGLQFIVNAMLGRGGKVLDLVAGDPVTAHREGVRRAKRLFGAPVPGLADIVVAIAYPATLNLWQGGKALYAAERAVRPGGEIILVAPCQEGIGEHAEFADLLPLPPATIAARIAAGLTKDRVAAAAAYGVATVARRAHITLVSEGIGRDETAALGFRWAASAQRALDDLLERLGQDATITVLCEGAELLPLLPEEVIS